MRLALVKQLDNSFKSAYDSDYDYIKKLKVGEIYFFEVKRERNIKFHRKFFALIRMIYQNQTHYDFEDELREDLLISAGIYTTHISFWGEETKKAKSLKFSNMNQDEFDDMYNSVLDEIVKHFNFGKQDIINNVEQYF
ncbi:MAG: DUF1367 family protein [Flavobacteriaceae bacterium]